MAMSPTWSAELSANGYQTRKQDEKLWVTISKSVPVKGELAHVASSRASVQAGSRTSMVPV
eukprot:scaffold436_cov367-Prasinococcus_capsulatus_cf.AAC.6